ncbi:MAG: T9SS type A sorting domain-containing protein [Ignavibacteria bacterium]|nr:T9SS type A sorting domain-containing protein [Ignavibacteria bacterium]
MKRFLLLTLLTVMLGFSLSAQGPYRTVTIKQLQQVSLDSLLLADQIGGVAARWTLQTSAFYKTPRETVDVVAQCVVPPGVITFSTSRGRFTMVLRDPDNPTGVWSSILVFPATPFDTSALQGAGFLNVEQGDIIRIRGYIDEFPTNSMNSATQFAPIAHQIAIIGQAPVPEPPVLTVRDFYRGSFPGGTIGYSKGEPYEGAMVMFTNLTVASVLHSGNGTANLVDAEGNMISTYDASGWFTTRGHRLAASTYQLPAIGSVIDTLRGMITTVSGAENERGFRLSPMMPGDIKIGKILPSLTSHSRTPIVVSPSDTAKISVRAFRQTGGSRLERVLLRRSMNNGPFVIDTMKTVANDSMYHASIPPQSADAFVKYFITAVDSAGNAQTLASSAFGGVERDTSKGVFFYTVLNRALTTYDVQWTPFANGRSPYVGAVVTVAGVVTADSSDLRTSPISTAQGGTNAWYIQNGTSPWNGLWLFGADSTLAKLRKGDSISVTGTVQENFDVTRLGFIQHPVQVHATGRPLPQPVVLTTGIFDRTVGNGTPSAEQWEGMLVRFNNVTITSIDPTFADPTEYEFATAGSGSILVRRDGMNTFSNVRGDTVLGNKIFYNGDKFSFVQGIMFYANNRYKFVPRGNSDFGTYTTGVVIRHDETTPGSFALAQNYPNPFNPTTTIQFDVPQSANVRLSVYNMLGQEVRLLLDEQKSQGRYSVRFDARLLPSGVYFYRLVSGEVSFTKRMVLIK